MYRKRILVVDDEPLMREFISETLRRRKYDVQVALDGADAVEKLENWTADLVISDIKMPGNPELQFIQRLPEIAPGMPAILVTGYPSRNSAIQAVQLPVLAYVTKPVDLDELLAHVRAGIGKSRLRRAVAQTARRLKYWLQSLEDIEQAFGDKNVGFSPDLLKKVIDLTFDNAAGAIDDIKTITAQAGAYELQCPFSSCNTLETLTQAVEETVKVLEKTKNAFKSKELGALRKKLEEILANLRKD